MSVVPGIDAVAVAGPARRELIARAVEPLRRRQQRDTPDDVALAVRLGVADTGQRAFRRRRRQLDVELGGVVQREAVEDEARRPLAEVDHVGLADAAVDRAQRVRRLPPRVVLADHRLAALAVDRSAADDGGAHPLHGDELQAGARVVDADRAAVARLLEQRGITRLEQRHALVDPQRLAAGGGQPAVDLDVARQERVVVAVLDELDDRTPAEGGVDAHAVQLQHRLRRVLGLVEHLAFGRLDPARLEDAILGGSGGSVGSGGNRGSPSPQRGAGIDGSGSGSSPQM